MTETAFALSQAYRYFPEARKKEPLLSAWRTSVTIYLQIGPSRSKASGARSSLQICAVLPLVSNIVLDVLDQEPEREETSYAARLQ
jgi:hypothetical protein